MNQWWRMRHENGVVGGARGQVLFGRQKNENMHLVARGCLCVWYNSSHGKGTCRMRKFFDRERQLEKLEALWRKDSSSFVVVAGGPAAWQMSGF